MRCSFRNLKNIDQTLTRAMSIDKARVFYFDKYFGMAEHLECGGSTPLFVRSGAAAG